MDYCLAIASFQKAELHCKGLVPAALFGPQPFFLENEVEWGRPDPSNVLLPVCFWLAKHSLDTDCFSSAPSSLHIIDITLYLIYIIPRFL